MASFKPVQSSFAERIYGSLIGLVQMGVDWTFFVLWNECDCPAHSMFRGVNHAKTNFSVTSAYSSQTQPTITARLNFQVTASFRVMLLWSIWPASSLFCRAEQLWQQTMGQIIYRLEMWNVKARLLECTILVLLCFRWKIRARRALSSVHQVEADGTNIPQVGGKSESPASWMYNSSVVTFQVENKRWESTEQCSSSRGRWDKSFTGWKKCESPASWMYNHSIIAS